MMMGFKGFIDSVKSKGQLVETVVLNIIVLKLNAG